MDSEARLRLVTDAAGLAIEGTPIPLPSDSNDAWKIGELVLRICWRGDHTRLHREAVILEHLPEEVPHVGLADAGVTEDLTWTLTTGSPAPGSPNRWHPVDHRPEAPVEVDRPGCPRSSFPTGAMSGVRRTFRSGRDRQRAGMRDVPWCETW